MTRTCDECGEELDEQSAFVAQLPLRSGSGRLRRRLGDERLEEAWTAGRAVTDEQAVELALSIA